MKCVQRIQLEQQQLTAATLVYLIVESRHYIQFLSDLSYFFSLPSYLASKNTQQFITGELIDAVIIVLVTVTHA